MKTWRLLLAAVGFAAFECASTAKAGERYAFLVAVSQYDQKDLQPLKYTQTDILDFRDVLLKSGYGRDRVVVLHDDRKQLTDPRFSPERAKILRELAIVLAKIAPGDSLVVALCGHGVQPMGDAQSYFCPLDAQPDRRETLIRFDDLYQQIARCKAAQKLLLIDACRDDPLSAVSRSRARVDLESVTRPQDLSVPEGVVALFSCSAGQRSFELPKLKHGIFFHHVLEAWKGAGDDGDRKVTLDELVAYTRKQTEAVAKSELDTVQTPQLRNESRGTWVLNQLPSIVNVSGRFYNQKYGWLVLSQKGAQVTGEMTYPNGNKGTMTGTVTGRTMDLRWSNGADSGTARLVLSDGANELAGNWVGQTSRDEWRLVRK